MAYSKTRREAAKKKKKGKKMPCRGADAWRP